MAFGDQMKLKIIALAAIILFFAAAGNAIKIEVGVLELLKGEAIAFNYIEKGNIIEFSSELLNSGSTAYKARARVDILKDNKLVFTGWSSEKSLLPGSRSNFQVFWYPTESGNFTALPRFYFGNEILTYEAEPLTITDKETNSTHEIFDLISIKTYENNIMVYAESSEKINVILIPYKYPPGWIFEQKKVELEDSSFISLYYIPSLWSPNDLTLLLVSEDGKYYKEKTLRMEKEANPSLIQVILRFLFSSVGLF